MNRPRPHHRLVEHTGEVEMFIEAETLRSLFEEAARGLAELLAEDATGPTTGPDERISLTASDQETLLADWLNELVYRGEIDKRVYAQVSVERVDDDGLEAVVCGREPQAPRTAVKAATWHGLRIRPVDHGFEATIVLDV